MHGLTNYAEHDLHSGHRDRRTMAYDEAMADVEKTTLAALIKAQAEGREWLLVTHGRSTSRPGRTTARSVVRGLMRSSEATPYIIRKESIQHDSVFAAKLRALTGAGDYSRRGFARP